MKRHLWLKSEDIGINEIEKNAIIYRIFIMDLGYFLGQFIAVSCIPLIYYAVNKKFCLKDLKKARWQFIAVFIFMALLTLTGSNEKTESASALLISFFVYIFTYKHLKNKYEPSVFDFESLEGYVAALAKKRNIKYPVSKNIIAIFGNPPMLEDYESIPIWVQALKKYFDDIKSI